MKKDRKLGTQLGKIIGELSDVNRLLPKASRHNFEGDAARTILSLNQVIKLEVTPLCKLHLGNSLSRADSLSLRSAVKKA